jgi:SAM-dependent methyltransferase/glycosyltransferase involved in cell wall biosynthesis
MLDYTGERYLPWLENAQAGYEHLHRYIFAKSFAEGKRVLDLASGEGYGAALLAEVAESVLGVDIDAQTIQHAGSRYLRPNLKFLQGSILDIPLHGENLFDLVVCFEAIEHIDAPEQLLSEVKRVLKRDGVFIVSTPNKLTFSDETGQKWPWHTREFYFPEFRDLLGRVFKHAEFLGQRVFCGSNVWSMEKGMSQSQVGSEIIIKHREKEFEISNVTAKTPLFFVALASDSSIRDIESKIRMPRYLFDVSGLLLKEKNRFEQWLHEKDAQLQTFNEQLLSLRQQKEANATLNQTHDHFEHIIQQKDERLQTLGQQLFSLNQNKEALEARLNQQLLSLSQEKDAVNAALNRIYNSHGWKALLAYYRVRNLIFPPGSRRKFLAQKIFHTVLRTKQELKTEEYHHNPTLTPAQRDQRSTPGNPLNIAACTIVSKNYIAFARTLAESFHRFHPETAFFVLLVDRIDGYIAPRHEPFHLVMVEELNISNFDTFSFKYNIVELNTAVKPYFLSYLFEKLHLEKLIYLDPDILITEKLDDLYGLLNEHSIVLVPHLTSSIEDDYRPTELNILQAGTYNLGFIGLANSRELAPFLKWWENRVYDGCFMAPEEGMHVDQKWIDLVPGLFDRVFVLRHPGYDVAYWNLHDRSIGFLNEQVVVNGGPCYFFHFSGFDPADVSQISKHQDRFSMKDIGEGARLFERYGELVHAHGHQEARKWPYAFGYFDNGARIPDIARQMYHRSGKDREKFRNPFSTDSRDSFFNWLNAPADDHQNSGMLVSRLWNEIYLTRPDLQAAFPDIFAGDNLAFSHWIRNSGIHEYLVDTSLVPEEISRDLPVPAKKTKTPLASRLYVNYVGPFEGTLKSTLKQSIGHNEQLWTVLKKTRNRMIYGKQPRGSAADHDPPAASPREFGVNLAGYLRSEKGVGEAGRAAARALEAASIPYALNDVVDSGSINSDSVSVEFTEENPYSVNLIHVNADQVPNFASEKGAAYFAGRYTIGCWFWELSQFPEEWYSSFGFFNEVWAPTSFIQDALSRVSPIPIVKMPLALAPEPEVVPNLTRNDFGLPTDNFLILSILDFASVLERKNPLGLITAFKQAFGTKDDATLVLKVAHSEQYPSESDALKRACSAHNVRIIDRILGRQEINTLLSLCDCYASLHRSEGYGLPIAEAMTLGKPVVVTAYSGNMDFTTPANSFLVKYKLVEIDRDYGPYRKGWTWADPDLGHAAELLRSAYKNIDLAAAIGTRAREDIRQLFQPRVVAKQLRERLVRVGMSA